MFKGLRTKIEGEQRGLISSQSSNIEQGENHERKNFLDIPINQSTGDSSGETTNIQDFFNDKQSEHFESNTQNSSIEPSETSLSLESAIREISELKCRLESVVKERDECNNQKQDLNNIIEKLEQDLTRERELNLTLKNRLKEFDPLSKESLGNQLNNHSSSNISAKSLNPESLIDEFKGDNDDVDNLKERLTRLESQLVEKNRQLKIRQQNLNDMKKALQKEFMDHNKTQEELAKLQNQMKNLNQRRIPNDSATPHNGSLVGDIDPNHGRSQNTVCDKNQDSLSIDDGPNNSTSFTTNQQPDRISCYSHSSAASVEEYESDANNQLTYNKEVNHEYLRNVLYRYMTSTDNATAQHLVKALSVLMNFTPEQYNAIKNAMSLRSSWLRLK